MKTAKLVLMVIGLITGIYAQAQKTPDYWNYRTTLMPKRFPLPNDIASIGRTDIDKDGDPDIIRYHILDSMPVMWVDDDDDMEWVDIEGDMDSDCLFVDKNNDGEYSGPEDLSIDWNDENKDGTADMQFLVENGKPDVRYGFDWKTHLMLIIDEERDDDFTYIDWNILLSRYWEHTGHGNFFTDYHGNTLFTKMCISSYRNSDLRYSWENPFLFWDFDKDGMSEMALRMIDYPVFRTRSNNDSLFDKINEEYDVMFSKRIKYVSITYDLDNDNGQGNECDFDFSLCFQGEGFEYSDQVNKYKSLRGLPEADTLLYNPNWRQLTELIFPNRETALDLTFNRGDWNICRLVFDEDDDCTRWERVDLYDPGKLFVTGGGKGGIDNNGQTDAVGDRGEFDMDFSGSGNLYIGGFDNRLHLSGAEWGVWRIDQTAFSYQGFGGLYDLWKPDRIQRMPEKFGTIRYSDTDQNGFFDFIQYDLDGDTIFERSVSLKDLNIDDRQSIILTKELSYKDYRTLFDKMTRKNWEMAKEVLKIAEKFGIRTNWYAFWKNPRTLFEKYQYAFWLNYYIYNDLRYLAEIQKNVDLVNMIDKAYFSGNWDLIK